MTMTNDVLEQLNYLKLKSAYSYFPPFPSAFVGRTQTFY